MKESQIEAKLVRMVREHGGLCYKFVSPNNPGVPDRIIITPDGRTVYVELKTEVGRLANIQQWQISENAAQTSGLPKGCQPSRRWWRNCFRRR